MTAAQAPMRPEQGAWTLLFLAWMIALLATAGALFLGEVMGKTPCVLCWYQRIAMYPLALLLPVAAWRRDDGFRLYGLLLAGAGLVPAGARA